MYADNMTDSMKNAIEITKKRRALQDGYNKEHGITPKTIEKKVREVIAISKKLAGEAEENGRQPEEMDSKELSALIEKTKKKMEREAADLNFEAAAQYRDRIIEWKNMLRDILVTEGERNKED